MYMVDFDGIIHNKKGYLLGGKLWLTMNQEKKHLLNMRKEA